MNLKRGRFGTEQLLLAPDKRCTTCGETKSAAEFSRNKRSRDGLMSICRLCNRAKVAAWQAANRERATQRNREWKRQNADYMREYARERYHADVEQSREAARRVNNTEQGRARRERWRQENKDKVNAAQARRRAADPEKYRDRQRAWKRANPDKVAADNHSRRSGRYDADGRAYLSIIQRDPCAYCGTTSRVEVDHIVPLSQGGENRWQNLSAACRTCNTRKNARSLLTFMAARR